MSFTFEKVAELKYDELITLYLIETEELLNELFVEKVKTPFNLLYKFSKEGGELLSDETKEVIFQLFDNIILTKKSLADRYQHLQNTDYVNQVLDKKGIDEVVEPIPVVEETPVAVVATPKKEKALPRRYGLAKVLKDIKEQNSKPTVLQRCLIKNNTLKNLYLTLERRLIKKTFKGDERITDEDLRKIISAITTFERQIDEIIKK